MGFGIVEYNNRPIIEKKKEKKKKISEGKFLLENGCKSREMKSIVSDLSEKSTACIHFGKLFPLVLTKTDLLSVIHWGNRHFVLFPESMFLNG